MIEIELPEKASPASPLWDSGEAIEPNMVGYRESLKGDCCEKRQFGAGTGAAFAAPVLPIEAAAS
ncbi:hypothetical protein [Rhizobium sp. BG4]|jgi:hypothetical protein|uniref:hypothetical protein n=1 Tax=Rhizobium sp. BG4 TaxID=2613770 RepID=UPI0011D143E2|nr:hypothetical protein [Rhizobium sp. BG4]QRM44049.1 hypothetical protein F2982_11650 [Rhizobium sp. BG4]